MKTSENVAVVGAGIVGLAHAWSAAERGHNVTVFERTPIASGASIRNFGMVWPIGQPESTRPIAMCARNRWLQLGQEASIWINPYGSLHLAHHADEWDVLQEFYQLSAATPLGAHLRLLDREDALERCHAINPDGFMGAMYSDLEVCVNPTEATRQLPKWLAQRWNVRFQFECAVIDCQQRRLRTSTGQSISFDRIIVCSGHDFETLYPSLFSQTRLLKCKLQMMRTVAQQDGWKLSNHIASGLTLRHYTSFRACPSLQKVKDRFARECPDLDRFGIHVMASQDNYGRVILGDSHEYDQDIEPFDNQRIDDLILAELHKIIRLPNWKMDSRWHGIYSKNPDGVAWVQSPESGVHICTGLGGAGMTLAFGIAENNWNEWSGAK